MDISGSPIMESRISHRETRGFLLSYLRRYLQPTSAVPNSTTTNLECLGELFLDSLRRPMPVGPGKSTTQPHPCYTYKPPLKGQAGG